MYIATRKGDVPNLRLARKSMQIRAILFDADGVIQRRPMGWRSMLPERLGFIGNADDFMTDVFAAELPTLEGQMDFAEALSTVLSRWNCTSTLRDALDAWTMIETDVEVAETIRRVRRLGVACYLATNQESRRARHMSETLQYRNLFDKEFYSCQLGVMKPAPAYFQSIIQEIRIHPSNALFIDDHQDNVEAARQVGLHAVLFSLESGPDALHRILEKFEIQGT